MTKQRYFFLILILGTLATLGPFSIDMYLPGFQAIAKYLHTTTAQVSLSLSSFFIGISAGQLIYGPLLDRFGRKKPLYVGLVIYIVASVGCLLVHTIEALIILRFVQAIGSCAAAVASVAMVRDLFPAKDNAKVFALLMLVISASPMLAPTAGGYVTAAFGWQWVFILLAAIAALILIAVIFSLPESYKPNPDFSLKPGPIIKSFLSVIVEPQFYTYAISGAFAFSGLFAYVSGSPLVFMDVFKVSGTIYGWIFALLSIGLIGSSQISSLLLKKFQSEQVVPFAIVAEVIVALAFYAGASLGWYNMYGTIVMIFLFLCCVGLTNPNTSALSIAPFSHNAGTASSLMGALQLGIGALASFGISLFNTHSAMPMAAIMAITSIIAMLVLFIGRRNIKHHFKPDANEVMVAH
ncbi:multidrug effflux MFS transporter [Mucilaginibacter jinjuensis]|uniref:Multidrug effflux MFS transporter n=1 Tax=Mucilaginibacter jinjuensis TaxID=1176721 RepID=A0ABY7T7S0_9SPHI|nr:multidrug effflux MFS transporter [Mucilaginibacter jinjuensis]WCT12524.1 multidrug effflux MFS transporter [Mucilaginibacter jinjuensis]